MTATVEKLTQEVQALPPKEFDDFLAWLAEFEVEQMDDWDREIDRDSRPRGRLETVLTRVRTDIVVGRTKPLDEVLHNS